MKKGHLKREVMGLDFSRDGVKSCLQYITINESSPAGPLNKSTRFDLVIRPNADKMANDTVFRAQWREMAYRLYHYMMTGGYPYLHESKEELCTTIHGRHRDPDNLHLGSHVYDSQTGILTIPNIDRADVYKAIEDCIRGMRTLKMKNIESTPDTKKPLISRAEEYEVMRELCRSKFDNLGQFFRK